MLIAICLCLLGGTDEFPPAFNKAISGRSPDEIKLPWRDSSKERLFEGVDKLDLLLEHEKTDPSLRKLELSRKEQADILFAAAFFGDSKIFGEGQAREIGRRLRAKFLAVDQMVKWRRQNGEETAGVFIETRYDKASKTSFAVIREQTGNDVFLSIKELSPESKKLAMRQSAARKVAERELADAEKERQAEILEPTLDQKAEFESFKARNDRIRSELKEKMFADPVSLVTYKLGMLTLEAAEQAFREEPNSFPGLEVTKEANEATNFVLLHSDVENLTILVDRDLGIVSYGEIWHAWQRAQEK